MFSANPEGLQLEEYKQVKAHDTEPKHYLT